MPRVTAATITDIEMTHRCQRLLRDGLSTPDIAARTGLTAVEVRARLTQALAQLRERGDWLAAYDAVRVEERLDACLAAVIGDLASSDHGERIAASREVREIEHARITVRLGAARVRGIMREIDGTTQPEGTRIIFRVAPS